MDTGSLSPDKQPLADCSRTLPDRLLHPPQQRQRHRSGNNGSAGETEAEPEPERGVAPPGSRCLASSMMGSGERRLARSSPGGGGGEARPRSPRSPVPSSFHFDQWSDEEPGRCPPLPRSPPDPLQSQRAESLPAGAATVCDQRGRSGAGRAGTSRGPGTAGRGSGGPGPRPPALVQRPGAAGGWGAAHPLPAVPASSGQRRAAPPHSSASLEPAAEGRWRRQRRSGRRVRERKARREARCGARPHGPTPATPSVARTRRGGTVSSSWPGIRTNAAAQRRAARASPPLHCGVEGAGPWSVLQQTPPSSRQLSTRPPAHSWGCDPATPWPSSPHFIFTGRVGGGGCGSFSP